MVEMKEVAMTEKLSVLFLCTGNSCRSQMAEGLCRELKGDVLEAYSAGTESHGLNPLAVKVMDEIGIDISHQRSKTTEELGNLSFDYVVTVCHGAMEKCPWFPAKTRVIHRGFDDPPELTAGLSSEKAVLRVYRRVRDEIREFIEGLPEAFDN